MVCCSAQHNGAQTCSIVLKAPENVQFGNLMKMVFTIKLIIINRACCEQCLTPQSIWTIRGCTRVKTSLLKDLNYLI